MKKGQGMSVNVIVIAAIALIILVILTTLVIQRGGILNRATSVCEKGNALEHCRALASGCNPGEVRDPNKSCLERGTSNVNPLEMCCVG